MRLKDWESRLSAAIKRHIDIPFGWGLSDCFTLPMDCVEAVTGTDPWEKARGYKTEKEAARLLIKFKCADVGEAFEKKFPEIVPALAQRGDIGVVQHADNFCGVVIYTHELIGKGEKGIMRWPRSKLIRAFSVR